MNHHANEEIAGLRAQIKAHRERTKRMRLALREINGLPFGRRDPIGALRLRGAINDRMHAIRGCEGRIIELQAEAGTKRKAA